MDNLLGAEKNKNEALTMRIRELEKQMAEPKNSEPLVPVDPATARLSAQLETALSRMNDLEEKLRNSQCKVLPEPGAKGHAPGPSNPAGSHGTPSSAHDSDEDEEGDDEEECITTPSGVKVTWVIKPEI